MFILRFGTFGFAYYTLGFELAVEESYPIDQTFGTAMLFFSGQLQGAILIAISILDIILSYRIAVQLTSVPSNCI